MLLTGIFVASITLFVEGHSKVYGTYRRASCGETINTSMGVLLPLGEKCEIYIDPPVGKAMTMDLFWARTAVSQQEMCSSIQITDDDTQREDGPCYGDEEGSFFFTGQARTYTLKLNYLEHDTYTHIEFVKPRYKCNSRLKYEMYGIPVEFTKNSTDAEECMIAVPPSSAILIEHTNQSRQFNDCIQIYVTQGPSLRRATVASHLHCVGEEGNKPLELLIFCHAALLHIHTDQPEVTVRMTVISPSRKQIPRMIIKHAEHCANYNNYNGHITFDEA